MNGLAVGQLNGQPLAAAQTSPLEYVAPSRRHHALAEAVCAQALAYFGLPGSLGHGEGVAEWAEGPSTRSLFPNRQTGSIGPCTTLVKFKRPPGQSRRGLDRYCSFQSDPRIRQQVGMQRRISKAVIGSRAVANLPVTQAGMQVWGTDNDAGTAGSRKGASGSGCARE